jgi:homoprotocatechuate degradation regulator HpaR
MDDRPTPLRKTGRSLPIALLRAREAVMGPIRGMLSHSGVNEQKWRVLRILEEQGPLEVSQVADKACLLLSSLTRMIGPMVREGLVTRHTPPQDRRKAVIAITEAGAALIHRHAADSAAIFARIEADFGRDRLEVLLDLLEHLKTIGQRSK